MKNQLINFRNFLFSNWDLFLEWMFFGKKRVLSLFLGILFAIGSIFCFVWLFNTAAWQKFYTTGIGLGEINTTLVPHIFLWFMGYVLFYFSIPNIVKIFSRRIDRLVKTFLNSFQYFFIFFLVAIFFSLFLCIFAPVVIIFCEFLLALVRSELYREINFNDLFSSSFVIVVGHYLFWVVPFISAWAIIVGFLQEIKVIKPTKNIFSVEYLISKHCL